MKLEHKLDMTYYNIQENKRWKEAETEEEYNTLEW